MVIHLLAVAKLPFIHLFGLSPLLWPFNLCLPLVRHLPRVCNSVTTAFALFAFRLRQIIAVDRRGHTRWERAVRLFCEEMLQRGAHPRYNALDDSSLQALLSLSF